ncbi:MAG: hypothetical protein RL538_892 [Candidatus Parcubacteria bacterium]|jgi:hypothetical protein
MTNAKPRFSLFDPLPSENAARAALSMEHLWPELNEFVLLEDLALQYNFDVITLEIAARELVRLNILEPKSGTIVRKSFFIFPYNADVQYFRRMCR